MSLLENFKVYRKYREEKIQKEYDKEKKTGIIIGQKPYIDENNKIYFILTNIILNFLIVVGAIGCFIKCFDISCDMKVIIISTFIMSAYSSFLYYNMLVKVTGYAIESIVIACVVYEYGSMIRGGFGTIANAFMEFVEKDMDLPIERRYTEYIQHKKLAVTICVAFVACMIVVIFNILISEIKGFALILLISFPIAQIGMYFDLKINVTYFVLYISGMLSLFLLRNTRHYKMEDRNRWGYLCKQNEKQHIKRFDYVNDGKVSLCILLFSVIMVVLISTITSRFVSQKDFSMNTKYDEMKDNTRDFTRTLILIGFNNMLKNGSTALSGISNNKLGQYNKVTYDYKTDLLVSTAELKNERYIYIKSGNGTIYSDNSWKNLFEYYKDTNLLKKYGLSAPQICTKNLLEDYSLNQTQRKMEIYNWDANEKNAYFTYHSNYENDIGRMVDDDYFIGTLEKKWYITLAYDSMEEYQSVDKFKEVIKKCKDDYVQKYAGNQEKMADIENEEKYNEYVKKYYMDIPEANKKIIQQFCSENHITENDENVVEKVIKVFQNDYEYTLMPGKTPKNKDFINYFLDETKKGYCTYFASSAVLIYRYLGIPARYTYGYKISGDTYDDSNEKKNENTDDWVLYDKNNDSTGKIVIYKVPDNCAHAWVEIYIDGFGWIPVEVTPFILENPEIQEENKQNNGVISIISNTLFSSQTINKVKKGTIDFAKILLCLLVIGIIAFLVIGVLVRNSRKRECLAYKNYLYICKCMKFIKMKKEEKESYCDFGNKISECGYIEKEKMSQYISYIEKEKFSKNSLTKDEQQFVIKVTQTISKNIFSSLKWYKKIIYRYIRLL